MGNTKTKTQEDHKMKTAGYWSCRNEIIAAHLPTPHKYEPFTEFFDVDQLDAIRDKYGVDLYRESTPTRCTRSQRPPTSQPIFAPWALSASRSSPRTTAT